MNGSPATLWVRDVAVARGGRRVVEGATFDLGPGEVLLLKGANGAGKTSLLRAIAGLAPIESGRATVGDDASPAARRAAIVYCGHADGVKAAMTARENLKFWAALYGVSASAIGDALASFDLAALADAPAAILSAGQRRRLGLSRLHIAQRPVWLLDEPTASMDAASSARLLGMVEAHAAAGGAVIIAAHNAIAVKNSRTLVIEGGGA